MCKKCKKAKKYLLETHSHLIEGWHKTKNGDLKPEHVTYGSHKKVFWECDVCRHIWVARVYDRTRKNPRGCPSCSGNVVSDTNNLAVKFPGISLSWHPTKNGLLKPYDFTYGSHRKVHWKCQKPECGYEWEMGIYNRTSIDKQGCPACSSRAVSDKNNLAVVNPGLAAGWHKTRNGDLKPTHVLPQSNKKVWWKCDVCGYSWKSAVCNRTGVNSNGCPMCANKVLTSDNSLETLAPEVSKDWHPTKNGDLLPSDFFLGANVVVWWLCDVCKHSWEAMINNRTKKYRPTGCPYCAKCSSISKPSQKWLDDLNVEVREHYIKGFGKRGFKVDGFCPRKKIVYEFLGDYWHGNPDMFKPEDFNKRVKKSFGQLHKEWLDRKDLLEKAGYKVVYIWESDFLNV